MTNHVTVSIPAHDAPYVSNILQKLNVRDRTQAALKARELKLL